MLCPHGSSLSSLPSPWSHCKLCRDFDLDCKLFVVSLRCWALNYLNPKKLDICTNLLRPFDLPTAWIFQQLHRGPRAISSSSWSSTCFSLVSIFTQQTSLWKLKGRQVQAKKKKIWYWNFPLPEGKNRKRTACPYFPTFKIILNKYIRVASLVKMCPNLEILIFY